MEITEALQQARWRRAALAVWDVLCWFIATFALVAGRYDFALSVELWQLVLTYATIGAALHFLIGWFTKAYRGRHRVGSFEESAFLAKTIAVSWVALSLLFLIVAPNTPRGMLILVPFGTLLLMAAGRFVLRALVQRALGRREEEGERVLVYGAGNAGFQVSRLMTTDPDSPFTLVGFIDDDPSKRNLHIGESRVLGDFDDLEDLIEKWEVDAVLLAVSNAPVEVVRRVTAVVESKARRMLVLPPLREIVNGRVNLSQVHEVDVADLLGRKQIRTDLSDISRLLHDKVVLVTGAGGSIGSEIARQVHRFGPRELVLLDRDESGLHATQLSIYGKGLLDTPDVVLCDIRDADALDAVFAEHLPDVVFHAAALKHLPLLEQYPTEAWKTNVLGSKNVLAASKKFGVERFVNISTDKAADPTSILGKSKRLAEELTAWYATQVRGGLYLSVRFGNVLGSRGSVLHTFKGQIASGGPITVTDPDVTRYFMTIPEACELTLQAAALGHPAEVLVLDMGEPVRIVEVAERMIQQSGEDIDIVYTGLRGGEKMHEVLFSGAEDSRATAHPLISAVEVPALAPGRLNERSFVRVLNPTLGALA